MTMDGTAFAFDSEHLIRSLFALIPVPIAIVDGGGRITMTNSSFSETFQGVWNISELPLHEVQIEGRGTFDIHTMPLADPGFRMVYAVDVANEVALRRQVAQLEKMAAIGNVVTDVASRLNAPLSDIRDYALLISRCEMDETARRACDLILAEASRAGNVVHSLSVLAGKTAAECVPFDLNEIVKAVTEARGYTGKMDRFDVVLDLDSGLPKAIGYPVQIEQVVLSLLINAEAAISPLQERPGLIELRTRLGAGRIQLHVSDNGSARDAACASGANHDGVGINLCSEIVKDHNGELYAWSSYNNGSTFILELPVSNRTPDNGSGILMLGKRLRGKSVIVIDDETATTDLIHDVLNRYGASVDIANSGAQAYEFLQNKDYDIIICDQHMPELSGQSIYRLVEEAVPNVERKFLFITDDVAAAEPDHFFSQTGLHCLRKPFRVWELLESIDKLFNRNRPHRS